MRGEHLPGDRVLGVLTTLFAMAGLRPGLSRPELRVITQPAASGPVGNTQSAIVLRDDAAEYSAAVPFTAQPSPTLAAILPQTITISGSPVVAGGAITVAYTVHNQGGTNAPASHTKVQIKNPSD